MNIELITTIIITVVTVIMFVISAVTFIRSNRRGYFEAFCVFGFFSFMTGHIFTLLLEAVGESSYNFNLGSLGTVSGLLCIAFSCNAVRKVDDEEDAAQRKKHALIALVVPLYFILCWVIMLCAKLSADKMAIATLYLFSALPCAYLCFKNIITPYTKESMMHCMKPFFIVIMAYCILMMLAEVSWLVADTTAGTYVTIFMTVINAACYILMPVTLARGNKKWTAI